MSPVEVYSGNDFYCDMVFSAKIEVDKVLETQNVLAFKHTKPSYPVHIVIVPKMHIASITSPELISSALLTEILEVIQKVADDVEKANGAARVITNLGKYQASKHLHFHVVFGSKLGNK